MLLNRDPRTLREHHVKELFGLTEKDKWPDAGFPAKDVDGVTIWVNPKEQGLNRRGMTMRVFGQCPTCGAQMALSRLFQHKVVHERKTSKEYLEQFPDPTDVEEMKYA